MNSPAPIRLRRMTHADLPQVEALDRLSFSDPWPPGSFLYELRPDASSICLVAESADADAQTRIVGYVVIWLAADEAMLLTPEVNPLSCAFA